MRPSHWRAASGTALLVATLACSGQDAAPIAPSSVQHAGQPGAASCQYAVTPVEHLAMPLAERGEFSIQAPPGCAWQINQPASWITLESPVTGQGPATIRYVLSPQMTVVNDLRAAPIEVRWASPTAGQNVWVRQLPMCATLLIDLKDPRRAPVDRVQVPAEGVRLNYDVLVDLPFSCPWSARSESPWLSLNYPLFPVTSRGDGGLSVTVAANNTAAERTGRVQVGERYLTVVQPPR